MVDSQLAISILDSSTGCSLTTDEVTFLCDVDPRPLCLRRCHLVRREFDGRVRLGPVCRTGLTTPSDHLAGREAFISVNELLELTALARVWVGRGVLEFDVRARIGQTGSPLIAAAHSSS